MNLTKTIKDGLFKHNELYTLKADNQLMHQELNEAAQFVKAIESGNLDFKFSDELKNSRLFDPLVSMQSHLKKVAIEESERNWSNVGLAEFSDLLRNAQGLDFVELANKILSKLIKYVEANQGAIFILHTDNKENTQYLELTACYAYDRKKYLSKTIALGEGLAGQCVLEKEPIFLTEIPNNYVSITSGLGESTPNCIYICPLMINDVVFGVLELASFYIIPEYKKHFIQRLSESLASTIKNTSEADRVKHLLTESQQQAEELRAQEEEMRQNMEELTATQEELQRKGEEIAQSKIEMEAILFGLDKTMATIEFTPDGIILKANHNLLNATGYTLPEIEGKHHRLFVSEHIQNTDEYINFWPSLKSGKSIEGTFERINKQKETIWLKGVYIHIRDPHGKVVKVIKFASDVTGEKIKEKEIQKLLELAKAQTKELEKVKASIEEQLEQKTADLKVREDVFGITTILSESDSFGTITYVNKKLCEVSKYTEDELVGKPHNIFRHTDMPKELYKLFWQTIQAGKVFQGIIKNKAKDGSHYWVHGTFVPIIDKNGRFVKYIGARYHITNDAMAEDLYAKQLIDLKIK